FRALALALALAVAASTAGSAAQPAGPLWPKADPGLIAAARSSGSSDISLIVREGLSRSSSAEDLVRSLHGTVTRELSVVGGFAARIPADRLPDLLASSSVTRVW